MKIRIFSFFSIVLPALFIFSHNSQADTLTFGIVPQQSAKKLAANWSPLFQYLSEKTGDKIQFATAKNIPTFEKRLAQKEYDIAYMNPYHFAVFNQPDGYQALAKQSDKAIRGIIVVHKDSGITSIEQLHEQKLAFPAPAAFAATIIPRAEMQKKGINVLPKFVSSHDSVYLNVSKKFFVAGGGVIRTLSNTPIEVSDQLKVIWKSQPYTPHAIAARHDLNPETLERLKKAMLAMNDDPEAKALLDKIKFNGFTHASNSDWDDVRALDINMLSVPES
ncbi:phosphate/phosphite/phosphonate ABC transporter substrate-binding protein [Alteromonadaceae bacterium M269]|nr:phosphate/phosphite/phosphonate ABC transporter substrate-binding protein [Alteromonadaceae bacterium M269]